MKEYPEYAEINGKEYKIDTDFRTALKCFEIIEDDIDNYEKAVAIVYLLFDFIPPEEEIDLFFIKAKEYLQCGKDDVEQNANKKDMDFNQDFGFIVSSFMSDYKLDITKAKLHFWFFIDLIEGLTESSSLSRIRELRNYDLSEEKDAKRKKAIKDAQKRVELKSKHKTEKDYTKEENANMDAFYNLLENRKE